MVKRVFALAFLCAGFLTSVTGFASTTVTNNDDHPASASQSVNAVIEWNRTLLVIVRTPGAQPSTIHSTRNFAMLHAAIFDAVNNIDQAAHDVLISLYPAFATSLADTTIAFFDTKYTYDL